MIFTETPLAGAWVIDLDRRVDERGFFARAWCRDELAEHGLNPDLVQANLSYNVRRGTLRGMHYQAPPAAEVKMVRCIAGAVYDVIVDVRPASATYLNWFGIELTPQNRSMLYVPEGFAHGYQTLTDDAEVFYMVTHAWSQPHERGIRWNDPAIGIRWPLPDPILSPRDQGHPDFVPEIPAPAAAGAGPA